jgi:hypothetical protein
MQRVLLEQGEDWQQKQSWDSTLWTGSQIEAYKDLCSNQILHVCVDRLLLLLEKVVEKLKQIIDGALFDLMMKHNPWTIQSYAILACKHVESGPLHAQDFDIYPDKIRLDRFAQATSSE